MGGLLGIAQFKRPSRQCLEIVQERDTGTFRFGIFISAAFRAQLEGGPVRPFALFLARK